MDSQRNSLSQLPLRVLVKGPSTIMLTSMMGGPRSDMAFPRVMERDLLSMGRVCEVRNGGDLGGVTTDFFKTWDADIAAWQPDVVVLTPGHMETVHALLPHWLERKANTEHRRPGFPRWKRLFFRSLARVVLKVQRRVDGPWLKRTRRANKSMAETQAYIDMTAKFGSPLILLMELHEPTQFKQGWFPGWTTRVNALNDNLRRMAETNTDKNVRFFEVRHLMEQFDPGTPEQLWADGIHFSPQFHRAIGASLAGVIAEWALNQPHLDLHTDLSVPEEPRRDTEPVPEQH